MPVNRYLNFDLQIEKSEEGFQARVINSPVGNAQQEFSQLFDRRELENLLLRLSMPRQRTREFNLQHLEAAKKFGGRLFATVFSGNVQRCLRNSLEAASAQKAGLRIRIQVINPELSILPWEFLYHPLVDRFLSLSPELPIARYAELPSLPEAPPEIIPPLRVLAMLPAPSHEEHTPVDIEQEWAILYRATRDLQRQGLCIVDRLEPASLTALHRQLQQKEYSILHFVGQSNLMKASGEGVLVVESEQKGELHITGYELGQILKNQPAVQLVLIDTGEGAYMPMEGAHAKIAEGIIRAGIPAVVAMQFSITAHSAIIFTHEFFRSLASGKQIDLALIEARQAMRKEANTLEWASPTIYLGSLEGLAFQVTALPSKTASGVKRPLANLFVRQGTQAGMNFPLMGEVYLIGRDMDLPISIQDTQVSRRHAQITFNSLGFWIEDLGSTNGTYVNGVRITGKAPLRDKDVIRLGGTTMIFDQASIPKSSSFTFLAPPIDETENEDEERLRMEVAALWTEAQAARSQQDWDKAIIKLQALLRIDPAHSKARAELEIVQQKQKIPTLFSEARSAQEQGDWETAIIKLQSILNIEPNHPDARQELQKALQRQHIASLYRQAKEAIKQNNRPLALAKLQAVLTIDPENTAARRDFDSLLRR